MKHAVQHIIMGGLIIMSALVFSCSDSERRMGLLGQTSSVVINLGLPADDSAANRSLIDRLRRFIARDAIAQTAPATFSLVRVRVTAVDIGVIEKEFNPYGTITLTVPSGSLRQFEVTAYVAPGDPSAATSFRGTAYANLPAGETVTVPVAMTLNETKIVIPDFRMNQLVQIDSLYNGDATWKTNALGYGINAYFYDVDFDARGRIYIGRRFVTGDTAVIRINNITSSTYDTIVDSPTGVYAIAIDRKNNYLYYATTAATSDIYRIKCNAGESPTPLYTSDAPIQTIRGMAFDGTENVLYIAGANDTGQQAIFIYSLNTFSVINTYINPAILNTPWHVLIKDPYVYVANLNGSNGYRVLLFNKNLEFIQGYGNGTTSINTNQGWFYGPRRFLAILNKKITLIDDDDLSEVDKLITMDNINGDGWFTYGRYNSTAGTGFFKFYYTAST